MRELQLPWKGYQSIAKLCPVLYSICHCYPFLHLGGELYGVVSNVSCRKKQHKTRPNEPVTLRGGSFALHHNQSNLFSTRLPFHIIKSTIPMAI